MTLANTNRWPLTAGFVEARILLPAASCGNVSKVRFLIPFPPWNDSRSDACKLLVSVVDTPLSIAPGPCRVQSAPTAATPRPCTAAREFATGAGKDHPAACENEVCHCLSVDYVHLLPPLDWSSLFPNPSIRDEIDIDIADAS